MEWLGRNHFETLRILNGAVCTTLLWNSLSVSDKIVMSTYRELIWKSNSLKEKKMLEKEKKRLLERAKKNTLPNHKEYRKELDKLIKSKKVK